MACTMPNSARSSSVEANRCISLSSPIMSAARAGWCTIVRARAKPLSNVGFWRQAADASR